MNKNRIGSSETIRKTTLCFSNYQQNTALHKKTCANRGFLSWFVGFAEGDGSFIVSNSRLFFIINQKDPKVLYHIRTNLGFGKVSTYGSYSRYIVADRKNTDRLIFLFNGNLLLDKTHSRFQLWLESRNLYSPEKIGLLCKHRKECFGTDAWLSGFIDAEGCFNVQRYKDSRYTLGFRVRLRFILDQKSELPLLKSVQRFLGKGHLGARNPIIKQMYRLTCTHTGGNQKIIDYLEKHPLRTRKRITFFRWKALNNYIKRRGWQGKVLCRVNRIINRIKQS